MSHGSALLTTGPGVIPSSGAPALTPYARRFATSGNVLSFSMGSIGTSFAYGTMAVLARKQTNGVWGELVQTTGSGTPGVNVNLGFALEVMDDNRLMFGNGAIGHPSFFTFTVSDGWSLIVAAKPSGSGYETFYKKPASGSWATSGSDSTDAMGSSGVSLISIDVGMAIVNDYVGDTWDGDIALVALWENRVLTYPTEIQTLDTSYSSWTALSPTWMIALNQPSVGTSVPDVTGGGGNQTSRTGTTVVTDGPALPGYAA